MNTQAFLWGRRAAHDPATIAATGIAAGGSADAPHRAQTLDELIALRADFLTSYQNAAYASRYRTIVQKVSQAEREKAPGSDELSGAVARALFKLMAVKDEYEVARLYTDGSFARQVEAAFDGDLIFEFHLAPPLLGRRNGKGEALKTSFGPRLVYVFKALARLKFLRATPFDIFGLTKERRVERKLIVDYQILLDEIVERLSPDNHALAVALAAIPEKIRGFGHVKLRSLEAAKAEEQTLLLQFHHEARPLDLAAE
jgi:indolepyruvate ferredoxin oxidoreductase